MSISLLALAAALQAAYPPPRNPPIVYRPAPPPVSAPPPLPVPPPPPLPRSSGQATRARANLASYIVADDYPVEAIRNDEQGVVGFRLQVGADGRARACTVTASSASASLDEATCRIMLARARFMPARDARGNPVEDVVAARLRWQIAEEPAPEPDQQADGTAAPPPPIIAQRTRPIAPLATYVTRADYPPEALRAHVEGITHFELTVGTDGQVSDCLVTAGSGSPLLDAAACRAMRLRARFTPALTAVGNRIEDHHWGHIIWQAEPPVAALAPAPSR